jgi:lipopolysaccharide/colanic/teichoic acid biosynthesis glycosyltransferase
MNNSESYISTPYSEASLPRTFHVGGAVSDCVPVPAPAGKGGRDNGLWLLRDVFAGHDGWSRVIVESAAGSDCDMPLSGRLHLTVKRAGDIAGSIVLLILLSPLLLLIALCVRLDSPGPALFRQRRIGKDGRPFVMWKFRSMRANSGSYSRSPTTDADRRLTRIGRLMRRISLDELPQLWNVVRGEMSLVGPRPEMPFIVYRYTDFERRRLAAKPGLTGLWQVSPARAHPIHENMQYDLHYIQHQNLLLDVAILLRTIVSVIRGVGAV